MSFIIFLITESYKVDIIENPQTTYGIHKQLLFNLQQIIITNSPDYKATTNDVNILNKPYSGIKSDVSEGHDGELVYNKLLLHNVTNPLYILDVINIKNGIENLKYNEPTFKISKIQDDNTITYKQYRNNQTHGIVYTNTERSLLKTLTEIDNYNSIN